MLGRYMIKFNYHLLFRLPTYEWVKMGMSDSRIYYMLTTCRRLKYLEMWHFLNLKINFLYSPKYLNVLKMAFKNN